ncbi:MAG: phenylacetate--CoA ligase family protein [Gammaproteobacteria bacterium]|nr:phenylacetate--CoA ligase family protein [Gammaproteobacteria bacterium]
MNLILPLQVWMERWVLERSCRWPRARIEAHQSRSVEQLRRFVLQRSPFYRRFHRGLEQRPLADLPILTKATVMENFDDLVTDRGVRLAEVEAFLDRDGGRGLFQDRYVVLSTSGTTGRRGLFLFSGSEWINVLASISRPLYWAGVYRRPWGLPRVALIASTVPWHYSARISLTLSSRLLPQLRLDAVQPVAEMVTRLNEWQPEMLAAYPSVVLQLAEEQIAGRLHIRPGSVMTSAEVLPEETRRRVREAWGVRMFDTYGTTEYAPVAVECIQGRKHLLEDGAVIEILDDKGRAVPPGTAGDRILLSVFRRRVQPLIRYEISDMVRPLDEPCECGRHFQVIDAIEGRTEDVLLFPARLEGHAPVPVHPNVFHDVLDVFPTAGWQVVQDESGLSVYLCGPRNIREFEALRLALYRALEAQNVQVPPIKIQPVDKLERGATAKAPLVVSRLGRAAG